jgi:5'-nucleotidase
MRNVLAFVTAGLLLLPVRAPAQAPPPRPITAGGETVTILHFNDVYEITPVDGGKAGGLARVAALRARLKARYPGLITTLGGDYLSPSALGTARVNGERLSGRQMVAVLNLVGLDWATLGNHEFDVPEAAFRARLAESKFHIVSSNVTDAAGAPSRHRHGRAVLPVKTASGVVRIGLIGLTSTPTSSRGSATPPAVARAAVPTG